MDRNMFQILSRHSDPDSRYAAALVGSVSESYPVELDAVLWMLREGLVNSASGWLYSRGVPLLRELGTMLPSIVQHCKNLQEKELKEKEDLDQNRQLNVAQLTIMNNHAAINIGEQKIFENVTPNTQKYVIHTEQPRRDQDRQADEHHDAAAPGDIEA